MNSNNIKLLVLLTSVAWNVNVIAAPLSQADYQASHARISSEQKSGKEGCNSLSGNARDICVTEVNGQHRVALAELESSYKPTAKNKSQIPVAKAEAAYAVAIQRCDDLAGNAKDICVKEAKSMEISAKADAKAKMKTVEAGKVADEKSATAQDKAKQQASDARSDASEAKRDASYEVAMEKCDSFSGDAKSTCADKAKLNFGK